MFVHKKRLFSSSKSEKWKHFVVQRKSRLERKIKLDPRCWNLKLSKKKCTWKMYNPDLKFFCLRFSGSDYGIFKGDFMDCYLLLDILSSKVALLFLNWKFYRLLTTFLEFWSPQAGWKIYTGYGLKNPFDHN